MARTLNGSTDKISFGTGGGVGAAHAWSASAWAYPTATTGGCFAAKRDAFSAGNDQFFFGVGHSVANLQAVFTKNGAFAYANEVATNNAWNNLSCACDSGGLIGYMNGTALTDAGAGGALAFTGDWSSGTGTGQTLEIGALITEASNFFTGRLADVALWNVKLVANEMLALNSGVRPYLIRPASLVFFCPLDGLASPEPDLSGKALTGTLTGTALSNGPPITLFTPKAPMQFIPQFLNPFGCISNVISNFTAIGV